MTNLSRSEQLIAEKAVCVVLIRGESTEGEPLYAYLAIRADKLQGFMKAQQDGTFYPEDHGLVLESGSGEPPADIQKKMTEEYGFNHDDMLDIATPDNATNMVKNIGQYTMDAFPEED